LGRRPAASQAHTAFIDDRSILVTNLERIRRAYLAGPGLFRADVVAAVPLDLVVWASRPLSPNWALMAWLRLPKVLRGPRVWRRTARSVAASHSISGVIALRLFPLLLGCMHLLSCALWFIGVQARVAGGAAWFDAYAGMGTADIYGTHSPLPKYLLSLFWVSTVMSTTGLIGGMTPSSLAEIVFIIGAGTPIRPTPPRVPAA
jgi:hypothetical protein